MSWQPSRVVYGRGATGEDPQSVMMEDLGKNAVTIARPPTIGPAKARTKYEYNYQWESRKRLKVLA